MKKIIFSAIRSNLEYAEAVKVFDENIGIKCYKINCVHIDSRFLERLLLQHHQRIISISFLIEPDGESRKLLAHYHISFNVKFRPEEFDHIDDKDLFGHLAALHEALVSFSISPITALNYLVNAKNLRGRFTGQIIKLNQKVDDDYALSSLITKIYRGELPRQQVILEATERTHYFGLDIAMENDKLSILFIEPSLDPAMLIEFSFLKVFLNNHHLPHRCAFLTPRVQHNDFIHCGLFTYFLLAEMAKFNHEQLTQHELYGFPDILKANYFGDASPEVQSFLLTEAIWLNSANLPEKCDYFTQSYTSMLEKLMLRGKVESEAKSIITDKKAQYGESNHYLEKRLAARANTISHPEVAALLIQHRLQRQKAINSAPHPAHGIKSPTYFQSAI